MRLAHRWQVRPGTLDRWQAANGTQYRLLRRGATLRRDRAHGPIDSLSQYVQRHGIFISDVVEASGLSRQTLNRLAKRHNTHRLRDLIAGVANRVV